MSARAIMREFARAKGGGRDPVFRVGRYTFAITSVSRFPTDAASK